jgi:RNA polymerase sigma-70 factor (ECF subfamily)
MSVVPLDAVERLEALRVAERTFQMTEEAFRVFYETTSRSLWGYLARTSGDPGRADDLLQETYYRFLRAGSRFEDDDHRRHYLFRIATNLIRDQHRRPLRDIGSNSRVERLGSHPHTEDQVAKRLDLRRAMARLTPRDRSLLWLAYAQGWSHAEIAATIGVKATSLKTLIYRARRRLLAAWRHPSTRPGGSS